MITLSIMEWKWSNGEVMLKTTRKKCAPKIYQTKDNLRENSNSRLEKREAMVQRNINPFLASNDYAKDVCIQDEFLRPKDSNVKEINA